MSSALAAGTLMLGCGEQRGESTTSVEINCFLGWNGALAYEGPLEMQMCWNSKCSGKLEPTIMAVSPQSPVSESAETTEAPQDEDIIEDCDRGFIENALTPPPCGGPVEEDPTELQFPGGVDPGCIVDARQSDFPAKACASTSTNTPGSTHVQIVMWPKPYAPGQGQDLLRDGDELSLHLEGTDGVLVNQTVTIDRYRTRSDGRSSCKSAGFDLDGQRL